MNVDKVIPFVMVLELILIILYGTCVTYADNVNGSSTANGGTGNALQDYYPFFQDVHVMIFVGFGFLMTFLKKYSYGAVGFTFLVSALVIQISILWVGFFHQLLQNSFHTIDLSIESLIAGDFAAGCVLITFGAVLGKVSSTQLIVIAMLEVPVYALNEAIGVLRYQAVDMGGSMYVHTFGAYFGLAVAFMLNTPKARKKDTSLDAATATSDTFAMVGTLFLWMFWPSFNGALATGNSQHRVVVNTVFALTSSCLAAFMVSRLCCKGKFDMVHIQNATLAGGVAVGSSADLVIGANGAMILGFLAGTISVLGYVYIGPFLNKKLHMEDTCGVHNLHGMPGLLGGLSGVVSAAMTGSSAYGDNIGTIFAARANGARSASGQAWHQLAALTTSVAIAIGGGLLTGLVARQFSSLENFFSDPDEWVYEESDDEEADIKELKQHEDKPPAFNGKFKVESDVAPAEIALDNIAAAV